MPTLEERVPESTVTSPPGYKVLTWGCQMNEEDSEQIALYLEGLGYAPQTRSGR